MKQMKHLVLALVAITGVSLAADAAGNAEHPKQLKWSFDGPFGTYDTASAQRGFQVYKNVCKSCHTLKYFRFRNLADLGYGEDMIKAFAAEETVAGEPDDLGDPTTRPGLPQDGFAPIFENDNQARASNGGALPPDLSLMVKARHDGANYLYSLMVGYKSAPAGVSITAGKHYNPYFKGGQIAMAPPLLEGVVDYEDGTAATPDQMAKDVVQFLAYVSEPRMEDRKKLGVNVMIILLILSILLYFSNKKIWKSIKEDKDVDGQA